MSAIRRLNALPTFPSPAPPPDLGTWRLTVDGLVARPLSLDLDDLRAMPQSSLAGDFRCEEGWEVESLFWSGVSLSSLLRLARPRAEARFVAVGAGSFVTALPREQIKNSRSLLAYDLGRAPLPWEHGGPIRLALAGGICYQSVKWVDRVTLTADASMETSRDVAMARRRA